MLRSHRRELVLGGVGLVVLVGAVGALLGEERVVHLTLVLLAGAATLFAYRASARSGRASRDLSLVRQEVRRVTQRQRRLGARLLQVSRDARRVRRALSRHRRLAAQNDRRIIAALEHARVLGEDRHQETLSRLSVVKSTVLAEGRATEAAIQLYPRIGAEKLLPATGNWAMDTRSLAHLVDIVESSRPRTVLELGSGTSTVFLGHLLRRTGGRLVSIDHDERFAARTRLEVSRHGLDDVVEIRVAPLEEQTIGGETGTWYALGAIGEITGVDLLLVDGPPGRTEPLARRHALPALLDRLAPGAVVVLDDADRSDEKEIVRRWAAEHPVSVVEHAVSRLAVLTRD